MKASTWAGATAGAALVYYLDDLRGADRRRRLADRAMRLWTAATRRWLPGRQLRIEELDLALNGDLTRESSYDWPLSVVTIDIDKALD